MANIQLVERHMALKAYIALTGATKTAEASAEVIQEAHNLVEKGLDRFAIVQELLVRFGHVDDTRTSGRILATLHRRHGEAKARHDRTAPRTEKNGAHFDSTLAEEITLNNTIQAVMEDVEYDLSHVLLAAGLDYEAGIALLSLTADKRHRYEENDPMAKGFARLIEEGLALNISSQFSGGSLGITLSAAGEIVYRLVTGERKLPRRSAPTALAA
ncbi:hypothetical protein [Erythrobacter aureus]|nr:hypothetical protein [Erythrobacter aureus]